MRAPGLCVLVWRNASGLDEARATARAALPLDPTFTIRRFRSAASSAKRHDLSCGVASVSTNWERRMAMEITKIDPLAAPVVLEFWSDGLRRRPNDRRYCKAKVIDIEGVHSSPRWAKKTKELIAALEGENAVLRDQAVELTLQIQALKDSRSR